MHLIHTIFFLNTREISLGSHNLLHFPGSSGCLCWTISLPISSTKSCIVMVLPQRVMRHLSPRTVIPIPACFTSLVTSFSFYPLKKHAMSRNISCSFLSNPSKLILSTFWTSMLGFSFSFCNALSQLGTLLLKREEPKTSRANGRPFTQFTTWSERFT